MPSCAPRATALLALLAAAACAGAVPTITTQAPETGKRATGRSGMVATASPWASEAGLTMLRRGGNAVDAAVAAAFAIGVVEPQMSGLGGGGVALVWLQREGRAEYLDFYAAQPSQAFRRGPLPEPQGPDLRVVAVPGQARGLETLHARLGRLPWREVLQPAIRLAEDGFPVNQVLAQMIREDSGKLARFANARALYLPDGRPPPPGARLRNPAQAAALRRIAEHGADGFHHGDVASRVVAAMNRGGHPVRAEDFAAYAPQWKRPLCAVVHGRVVLGAPPPQTGAQVIHTLKLLEPHDLPASGLPTRSARAFDLLVSVLRVGMADNLGNDDPDWRSVPAAGRVSDAFARSRAPLVGTGRAAARIEAATAAAFDTLPPAPACARLEPWGPARGAGGGTGGRDAADAAAGETTHISVVDDTGNAVALTQTNSSRFGTGALVDGFFLNDSGYRFADDDVVPPGPRTWRTRVSTIAPTIVLEGGRVRLVIGAPGAARIPTEVAQNMIYILEHGLDPMQAARMPRVFPSPSSVDVQLEHGFSATVLEEVRAMGYRPTAMSSGYARIYMVVRDGNRWIGVADPRHDGEVRGH